MRLNYAAIAAATVAVFVFAAGYYIVFARPRAKWSARAPRRPSPGIMAFELLKSAVLASVVAGLVHITGIADLLASLGLALALWLAFPIVLLAGSVTYEGVPWRLAAIHAGDWLAKLVIITVIVTLWR